MKKLDKKKKGILLIGVVLAILILYTMSSNILPLPISSYSSVVCEGQINNLFGDEYISFVNCEKGTPCLPLDSFSLVDYGTLKVCIDNNCKTSSYKVTELDYSKFKVKLCTKTQNKFTVKLYNENNQEIDSKTGNVI